MSDTALVRFGSRIPVIADADSGLFRPGITGSAFTPGIEGTTDQISGATVPAFWSAPLKVDRIKPPNGRIEPRLQSGAHAFSRRSASRFIGSGGAIVAPHSRRAACIASNASSQFCPSKCDSS